MKSNYLIIKLERCERCQGSGMIQPPDEEEPCPDCEGLGSIRDEVRLERLEVPASRIAVEAIRLYCQYLERGYDPERAVTAAVFEMFDQDETFMDEGEIDENLPW